MSARHCQTNTVNSVKSATTVCLPGRDSPIVGHFHCESLMLCALVPERAGGVDGVDGVDGLARDRRLYGSPKFKAQYPKLQAGIASLWFLIFVAVAGIFYFGEVFRPRIVGPSKSSPPYVAEIVSVINKSVNNQPAFSQILQPRISSEGRKILFGGVYGDNLSFPGEEKFVVEFDAIWRVFGDADYFLNIYMCSGRDDLSFGSPNIGDFKTNSNDMVLLGLPSDDFKKPSNHSRSLSKNKCRFGNFRGISRFFPKQNSCDTKDEVKKSDVNGRNSRNDFGSLTNKLRLTYEDETGRFFAIWCYLLCAMFCYTIFVGFRVLYRKIRSRKSDYCQQAYCDDGRFHENP